MSVPLVVNGVTYNYPQQFDVNWAPTLTSWSTAVTNGMLQKAGGTFTLTGEVDFGASFGIKLLTLKSETANIASTGFVRLAHADSIVWRNNANNADVALTVDSSNALNFNGVPIGSATSLTNGHVFVGNVSNQPADVAMSGDIAITNAGVTSIGAGAVTASKIASGTITDTQISASAAIAMTKLAARTASRALASDASGFVTTSATTDTELGYVSGVTSPIQTQINNIQQVPSGAMLDFAGTAAPTGWLLCDGSAVSRTTYSVLFGVIGTTWGSGNGTTTFNVPDFRRRTAVGSGGTGTGTLGNAVGNTGGEETHTMTSGELVAHSHPVNITDPGHAHAEQQGTVGGAVNGAPTNSTWDGSSHIASTLNTVSSTTGITATTSNTGSTTPFNVIQPSAVVLKIIKI